MATAAARAEGMLNKHNGTSLHSTEMRNAVSSLFVPLPLSVMKTVNYLALTVTGPERSKNDGCFTGNPLRLAAMFHI
jgi:hypothetical protein